MRPFILDLEQQLSQQGAQMRIIDLCEWGATSAMEKKHMTSSPDQFSHLLCKVPAIPIQNYNYDLFRTACMWEHPVKRFDHVLRSVRPILLHLHFHPRL